MRLSRFRLTTLALLALVACLPSTAFADGRAGTKVVRYHGYKLVVPVSWPVYDLKSSPTVCVRFNRHAVYLGRPSADQRCPAHAIGRTEAILVAPVAANGARAGDTAAAALPPVTTPRAEGRRRSSGSLTIRASGVIVTATWQNRPGLVERAMGVHSVAELTAAAASARRSSTALARAASAAAVFTGLGFDACSAPSASRMSAWTSSSYRAVGVYIGGVNMACSQPNLTPTWVSQESAAGWHLIPTYVGLQAPTNGCGCSGIDPAQASAEGSAAASDAVDRVRSLGIGPGNPIYYDMEYYGHGNSSTPTVLAFLSAWTSQLHALGYASGVYGNGSSAMTDFVNAQGTSFREPDEIWIAEWNGQQSTSSPYVPSSEWSNHQRLHQFEGGHDETYGGVTINVDSNYLDALTAGGGTGAAVAGPPIPDGTFVQVAGTQSVYRIAGGAPLFVNDWSAVGGAQQVTVISQQQFDSLNPVPLDGTFLQTANGAVYRVAGGAPLYVSNFALFTGAQPILIDQWDIDNIANPAAHLNPVPSDGTFLTTSNGFNYRVAGGAPIGVGNWKLFGGPRPTVAIDAWDIGNIADPAAHMNTNPTDGTVVEGLPSGAYWQFRGGLRTLTFANGGAVLVDDNGLRKFQTAPCVVPALGHMTLPQVKRALLLADCRLGKVHRARVTRRRHVLRVIKQIPRPRTRHAGDYVVGVTLG